MASARGGSHMKRMFAGPWWLGVFALAACGGESTGPTRMSVTVSPATVQRLVGASFSLRATVKDAAGNVVAGHTVTWTTSNSAVATVVATHTGTDSALVKAQGPGTASITAAADGQSGSAAITVVPPALAFTTNRDGNDQIYVVDAAGTDVLNLSHNATDDDWPSWSPDGSKIAFHSDRDGNFEGYAMHADGTLPVNLTNNPALDALANWSPDGSKIAFDTDRDGNFEVYLMNPDGTGLVDLTNSGTNEAFPAWSPDGSKIAFGTDRDGNDEVYVMNSDGTGLVNLTHSSAFDGYTVAWRPTGVAHAAAALRPHRPATRRRD